MTSRLLIFCFVQILINAKNNLLWVVLYFYIQTFSGHNIK